MQQFVIGRLHSMVFPPGDSTMNFPTSTHVGRLHVESRHLPATQGGGGDIHDVMATPFGVRLLVGDVMGTGLPANRTGLLVLNAWRATWPAPSRAWPASRSGCTR